jgi:NTP pyrophosphatase (non-canonical NTP hydrolase)
MTLPNTSFESANSLPELQSAVRAFCEARDWDQFHGPKDLAIGLITEASELLEHFRFKSEDECRALFNHPTKSEAIRHEIADVFFFLLRFSQMYGIDLAGALREKMLQNAEKYPVEKAKGSNQKYDEFKSRR